MALRPGDRFAGFTVERELGAGGMGEVYLARHPRLPRRVALKLLRGDLVADQAFVQRFQREAETVAGLDHPAIVPIDDCGAEQGRFWFSMRYIDGITADEALRPDPYRLDPARAVRIVERVASALDFAHRRNLVHRDVKPANILLSTGTDDDPEQVFLSDFGVAKGFGELEARAPSLTATGGVVATVDYAAPEQIEAKPLDGRCDVYALGCVLFKLLTGRIPFPGDSLVAKVHARMSGPTPKVSTLVPELAAFDQVIATALERDRDRRFQTCRSLAVAALAALTAPPAPAPDLSTTTNLGNATTTSLGARDAASARQTSTPGPPTQGPSAQSSPGQSNRSSNGPVSAGPPGQGQRRPLPAGQALPPGAWYGPQQGAPSPQSGPVQRSDRQQGGPWPGGPQQGPPPQAGPPAPSWPGAGWQGRPFASSGHTPQPPSTTPPPPSRTDAPMPTSIHSLLGATPAADRRRTVRNRSLLAVGLLVLVAAALVGTLYLTGGFTGSGNRGTTAATSPSVGTTALSSSADGSESTQPSTSSEITSEPPPTAPVPQAPAALSATTLVISAPVQGQWAVFAVDASTGGFAALTDLQPAPVAPVLSPDRRTAMWVDGDQLVAVGTDSSGLRGLFTMPADCTAPARPAWNPVDPTQVVVACTGSAGPRLLVLDLTGQVVRELSTADLEAVDDVDVSPDGTTVLFRGAYSTDAPDEIGDLWSGPLDGSSGPSPIIVGATDGVWSPDGTRLAYRKLADDGSAVIVVSDRDGGNPQEYSAAGAPVRAASFSPDGTQLAWTVLTTQSQVLMVAEVADPSSARPVGAGLSVIGPLTW